MKREVEGMRREAKLQREKDESERELRKEVAELRAELNKSRKRQREAEDIAASGIKVKQEVVEGVLRALEVGGRARKRARVAEGKAERAERRAEEAEERGQCGVCLDRNAVTALQPCGHRVCGVCAGQLGDVCPHCQGAVTGRLKTFV
jgi:hypothetical protein